MKKKGILFTKRCILRIRTYIVITNSTKYINYAVSCGNRFTFVSQFAHIYVLRLFFELHFINRWTCFYFKRPCKTSCNLYSPRDHLVLRLYLQYINLYNCSNYRNERGWASKLLLKIKVLFSLFFYLSNFSRNVMLTRKQTLRTLLIVLSQNNMIGTWY